MAYEMKNMLVKTLEDFPEEVSVTIPVDTKGPAETHLGGKVSYAVVAVPAHFNGSQCQATRTADSDLQKRWRRW